MQKIEDEIEIINTKEPVGGVIEDDQQDAYKPYVPQKKIKKKGGGFQSMNLLPWVFKAVMAKGYKLPTPIQRKAIPQILSGTDVVACSRTGSGKTAAFIIPMLNRLKQHSKIIGVRALIIVPTRELALQTHSVLKQFSRFSDLLCCLVIGGHGFEGQFEGLATNPDIIICTPGRLMHHIKETQLNLGRVEIVVFDECDHLYELGYSDQLKVILKQLPPYRQTLLFSATIPEELSQFAKAGLKDYVFEKLDSEYTISDKIDLHFIITRTDDKIPSLVYLLKDVIKPTETTIIFTSTKYHVEFLAEMLKVYGIYCIEIFGKMDQYSRTEQIQKFRRRVSNILVVTDLASRGLDIPFVHNVIHFDYPEKTKSFIHRTGRTARAGQSGTTYSLISIKEIMYIEEIIMYIGRSLSNEANDLKNTSKAFYGTIPDEYLADYSSTFLNVIKNDLDIEKLYDTSKKAFEKFRKTRGSASRSSVKKAKEINFNVIHPLFKIANNEEEGSSLNILEQIKTYKPKECYLEVKKNLKQEANSEFLSVIHKFKQQEEDIRKQTKTIQDMKNKSKKKGLEDGSEDEDDFNENQENEKDDEMEIEEEQQNKKQKKQQKKEKFSEISKIEKEQELPKQNGMEEYEVQSKNKVKKSLIKNFRHPSQYISDQPDINRSKSQNQLEDENKIQSSDINSFIIQEDFGDILRNKRKYVWDKSSKKYVQGIVDEKGRINKQDKQDKKMKTDTGKKLFKKWQRKNQITQQKVGEQEDENVIKRAKNLFYQRKIKSKYKSKRINYKDRKDRGGGGGNDRFSRGGSGGYKSGGSGGYRSGGGRFNQNKVRSEIKTPNQVKKFIQKEKTKNILNMNKNKRNFLFKNKKKN